MNQPHQYYIHQIESLADNAIFLRKGEAKDLHHLLQSATDRMKIQISGLHLFYVFFSIHILYKTITNKE